MNRLLITRLLYHKFVTPRRLQKMFSRNFYKILICSLVVIYALYATFQGYFVKSLYRDDRGGNKVVRVHKELVVQKDILPIGKCEAVFGEARLKCEEYETIKKYFNELKMNEEVEEKDVSIDDLVIVTAFSGNHLNEAECHCETFKKYPEFANRKVKYVAYLMGDISPDSDRLKNYKSKCPNFELRAFDFSRYPSYVSNLMHYRWKPLIVAEMLMEHDLIYYVDTSVGHTNTTEKNFEKLIEGINLHNPFKNGVLFVHPAQHPIIGTTNPTMYKYLPLKNEYKLLEMQGATLFLWKKTETSMSILRRWVGCALNQECIAPAGSGLYCSSSKNWRKDEYGNCHRYDQSALNIILANTSNGDINSYARWVCIWTPDSNIWKYINRTHSCYVLRQC